MARLSPGGQLLICSPVNQTSCARLQVQVQVQVSAIILHGSVCVSWTDARPNYIGRSQYLYHGYVRQKSAPIN